MKILLNGEQKQIDKNTAITALLKLFKIDSSKVVVEHNCRIIKREELASMILNEGDKIEVISFVGGG